MTLFLSSGISIVDSDLTTDVVEPADLNRFVSYYQKKKKKAAIILFLNFVFW